MLPTLVYRKLTTSAEMMAVEDLQRVIWPVSELELFPVHYLMALTRNGGLVLGAFDGDDLVGFLIGFLGTDQEDTSRPAMSRLMHFTHTMGVHQGYKGRDVEFHLKRLQRQDAIENDVRRVTWICDPLRRDEVDLSFRRLGAISTNYIRDYFGITENEFDPDYPSDRIQVDWFVTSRRVQSRVDELRSSLDLANFLGGGAQRAYGTHLNSAGILQPDEDDLHLEGAVILFEIPFDIDSIVEQSPESGLTWKLFTRRMIESAFAQGYIITDFVSLRDEEFPRSYYVLSHGEGTLG